MTKLINITFDNNDFKRVYGHFELKLKCIYKNHLKFVKRAENIQITCLYKDTVNYKQIDTLENLLNASPSSEVYIEEL